MFDFKKSAYDKINPLKSERENLWKKHKRAKTEAEKKSIKNQIAEISKKITPLAEEIRHCDNIQSRIDKIKIYELHQKLKEERQKAEQQKKLKLKISIEIDRQRGALSLLKIILKIHHLFLYLQ